MKVLFLDIDGVLNCESTKETIGGAGPFRAMHGLDTRLLTLFLEWRRKHPEVSIVLSSTWRLDQDLMVILDRAGIDHIATTGNFGSRRREIEAILRAFSDVTHYAILDDIAQFSAEQQPHFVQTSYVHGLRERDLKKLDRILDLNKESGHDEDGADQRLDRENDLSNQ